MIARKINPIQQMMAGKVCQGVNNEVDNVISWTMESRDAVGKKFGRDKEQYAWFCQHTFLKSEISMPITIGLGNNEIPAEEKYSSRK